MMSLATAKQEAAQLTPNERAMLIDALWESLDDPQTRAIEAKWASEAEERIDAFDKGELAAVNGTEALRQLRASLRK